MTTDPTTTPTPTETLRERVRGALATVPLGEDDVHVFYVAEKHLDRLTDAVLAAVSAAAPDERATDPLIVSAIRRRPSGTLRYEPANGPATGTSGRSFLAEYDAALAARPAPAVNAADVKRAAAVLLADYQQQYDGGQIEEFLDLARAVARALGLTVADEGRAEA